MTKAVFISLNSLLDDRGELNRDALFLLKRYVSPQVDGNTNAEPIAFYLFMPNNEDLPKLPEKVRRQIHKAHSFYAFQSPKIINTPVWNLPLISFHTPYSIIATVIDKLARRGLEITDVLLPTDAVLKASYDRLTLEPRRVVKSDVFEDEEQPRIAGCTWEVIGKPVAGHYGLYPGRHQKGDKLRPSQITVYDWLHRSALDEAYRAGQIHELPGTVLYDLFTGSAALADVTEIYTNDFNEQLFRNLFDRINYDRRDAGDAKKSFNLVTMDFSGNQLRTALNLASGRENRNLLPEQDNELEETTADEFGPPKTQDELVERLYTLADRLDGGYTAKGYAWTPFGWLTGGNQKASQLRALAGAISSDLLWDDTDTSRFLDVRYSTVDLQRRGTTNPFHNVDEYISVRDVAEKHRTPWLLRLLTQGRSEPTNTECRLGLRQH